MSRKDLINSLGVDVHTHTLYDQFQNKYKNSAIVNIYTISGRKIKVKGDSSVTLAAITPDYLTIKFDSHISDIMFTGIEEIEYIGGNYVAEYDNK